jgi:low affinity Fe/Cu permease
MKNKSSGKQNTIERLSSLATKKVGSSAGFISALTIILAWLISGPFFHYSNTWQLIVNTGTTVITFLMVFLIQRSQNKESLAIQIKLNELIASSNLASNRLIDVEDMTEAELETLEKYFAGLVKLSKNDKDLRRSYSIEEAKALHEKKVNEHKKNGR